MGLLCYVHKENGQVFVRDGKNKITGSWVNRLAEYENLGLPPKEIRKKLISLESENARLKEQTKRLEPLSPIQESLADRSCPACDAYISWDGLNEPVRAAPRFCKCCGQAFSWHLEKGYDPLDFID